MKLSTKDKLIILLSLWKIGCQKAVQVNFSNACKEKQVIETLVVFEVMENSRTPACNLHAKEQNN